MGDFHKAFEAIDENGSGRITVAELQHYMIKNNYKQTFVTKWLNLFDVDNIGTITYKNYCDTLGLIPKAREPVKNDTVVTGNINASLKTTASVDKTTETNKIEQLPTIHNFKDSTPAFVSTFKEDNDFVMEEAIELKHSNMLSSEDMDEGHRIKLITIPNQDALNSAKFAANVDNDVIMEKTKNVKHPKKFSLDKKSKPKNVDKGSVSKTVKESDAKKNVSKIEIAPEANTAGTVESKCKRQPRNPKSYPIQVKPKSPKHRRNIFSKHVRRIRASIQPGVILILLTGVHKGKRVVFLRALKSGLLLVTGPFKLNGCPLRRIHQKMVIATKTQIDISQVNVPDHINDEYFSRESKKKQANTDVSTIFAKTKREYTLKDERKSDQKDIDRQMFEAIKARDDKTVIVKYLKSMFSLSSHDCPHLMKF